MSDPSSSTDVDNQPEVVCLCGSTHPRFKDEYQAENRRLTMEGKIVISVVFFGHSNNTGFSEDEKAMLDELHKRKIDIADRIHIINVDGYIDNSTRSKIKYARKTGTDITYLSQRMATDGGKRPEDAVDRADGPQTEGSDHDAEMTYRDTRHGGLVSWGWTSGRRTVTPDEHKVIKEYTEKAEDRLDYSQLENGEVVAHIWMTDNEAVDSIEWVVGDDVDRGDGSRTNSGRKKTQRRTLGDQLDTAADDLSLDCLDCDETFIVAASRRHDNCPNCFGSNTEVYR